MANRQLRDLALYEPGKSIEETARELGVDPGEITKLASNENALGPSPKAVAAMRRALESAQLYPDGSGVSLREAIANQLGFDTENIILGNGSNEVIEFIGLQVPQIFLHTRAFKLKCSDRISFLV